MGKAPLQVPPQPWCSAWRAGCHSPPPHRHPCRARSQTLVFDVVFSPFEPIEANNVRNPASRFALGDEIVAHDQFFSRGQHAGDDALSCVIVSAPPAALLANCDGIFRLPGGTIAFQTTAVPGPAPGSWR